MASLVDFDAPEIQWLRLAPLLALLAGALVHLLFGSLLPRWPRGAHSVVTVATAGVAAAFSIANWLWVSDEGPATLVVGTLAVDHLAALAGVAACAIVALVAVTMDAQLRDEDDIAPEMHTMLLTSAIGALIMVAANDLLVLFLGLEILSLSFYLMAASNRRRAASQEAGLKYFILGGFASAFFLYGAAFVYGSTGSTNLAAIASRLAEESFVGASPAFLLLGVALLVTGFAFKVSAVPFQSWTPDVYQGAPSPVTALFASLGKLAAFVAFSRVLVSALSSRVDDWRPVIWVLAALTTVVGGVLAVVQTDAKRMLAFSSVSHAGFVLVGLEAAGAGADAGGLSAVTTYLILYAAMVIGSFAVVSALGDDDTSVGAFGGLARRNPALAVGLTVLLLAQAGMPVTSGFIAKFGVISAAVDAGSEPLAVVAMVGAVISAFVYLRLMMAVWNAEPSDSSRLRVAPGVGIAVTVTAGFTLVAGAWPNWLLDLVDSVAVLAR
jgi:NADH-quinone oxidoreductase subunit N